MPDEKPKRAFWTEREIELLEAWYPYLSALQMRTRLRGTHSMKAIRVKASRLGIRKDDARLSQMGLANVTSRWDKSRKCS